MAEDDGSDPFVFEDGSEWWPEGGKGVDPGDLEKLAKILWWKLVRFDTVCVAALASRESGEMLAFSAEHTKQGRAVYGGWDGIWKDQRNEWISQDDMTASQVTVNESECLTYLIDSGGKADERGFWVAGERYSVVQALPYNVAGGDYYDDLPTQMILALRPGKGVIVLPLTSFVIIAMFREDLQQNRWNAKKSITYLAEWLYQREPSE